MAGDFRGHRRRAVQTAVHPPEIVAGDVNRPGCRKVLQFLREAERQASKPLHQGSRREAKRATHPIRGAGQPGEPVARRTRARQKSLWQRTLGPFESWVALYFLIT